MFALIGEYISTWKKLEYVHKYKDDFWKVLYDDFLRITSEKKNAHHSKNDFWQKLDDDFLRLY